MSQDFNRHQDKRAFAKAKRIVKQWFRWKTPIDNTEVERKACRLKKNRKECSCEMCRNPRRSGWSRGDTKLTMQEVKANIKEKYDRTTDTEYA